MFHSSPNRLGASPGFQPTKIPKQNRKAGRLHRHIDSSSKQKQRRPPGITATDCPIALSHAVRRKLLSSSLSPVLIQFVSAPPQVLSKIVTLARARKSTPIFDELTCERKFINE